MAHGVSYLCIQLIPGIESTKIPSSNRRQLSLLSSRRNSHSSGSEQREPTLSKSQTKTIKMTFLIVVGELILFYLEFSIVCSKKSIRRRRLYVFNFIVIFFFSIFLLLGSIYDRHPTRYSWPDIYLNPSQYFYQRSTAFELSC